MTWEKIKQHLIATLLTVLLGGGVLWGAIRINAQAIGSALGFATKGDIERLDAANEAQTGFINTLRAMQKSDLSRIDSILFVTAQSLTAIENGNMVIACTFILQNPSVSREEKEVLRARLITRASLNQREIMERVLTIPIPEDKPKTKK